VPFVINQQTDEPNSVAISIDPPLYCTIFPSSPQHLFDSPPTYSEVMKEKETSESVMLSS
jgi:hypothetical protein